MMDSNFGFWVCVVLVVVLALSVGSIIVDVVEVLP